MGRLVILEFLLYTLTLECTLVSVKDLGGIPNGRILRGDQRVHAKPLQKAKGGVWGSCRQALTLGILRDKVDQGTLQPLIKVQNSFGLKVWDWPTLTKNRGPSMWCFFTALSQSL